MATKKKDQRAGLVLVITLFSIGAILPTLLWLLAIMGTDYQWLMFKYYIVVSPLALAGFLTGYYKPFIGGLLLIVTGFITILGYSIIALNTSGIEQDTLLLITLAVFIGLALLISGYSFITSRKVR
ncbi:hypothetical protein ACFLYS_03435 [Chloroflexota bacterium]